MKHKHREPNSATSDCHYTVNSEWELNRVTWKKKKIFKKHAGCFQANSHQGRQAAIFPNLKLSNRILTNKGLGTRNYFAATSQQRVWASAPASSLVHRYSDNICGEWIPPSTAVVKQARLRAEPCNDSIKSLSLYTKHRASVYMGSSNERYRSRD